VRHVTYRLCGDALRASGELARLPTPIAARRLLQHQTAAATLRYCAMPVAQALRTSRPHCTDSKVLPGEASRRATMPYQR
jgi:hypothetical protein